MKRRKVVDGGRTERSGGTLLDVGKSVEFFFRNKKNVNEIFSLFHSLSTCKEKLIFLEFSSARHYFFHIFSHTKFIYISMGFSLYIDLLL